MSIDLDAELRAFGAALQQLVGDPITPPDPANVVRFEPSRRRWVAIVGAAACVAVALGAMAWLRDGAGDAPAVATPPTSAAMPPDTTLADHAPTSMVDGVPPVSRPPSSGPPSSNEIAGDPVDSNAVTPLIDGRSVRFPGCPRLAFDGLDAGWGAAFASLEGSAAATLTGPSGTVSVSVAPAGSAVGTLVEVDGYIAYRPPAGAVLRIVVFRDACGVLALDGSDLSEADRAVVEASIDLDDRELTEIDAQISGTTLFDRRLFERVDADPFIDAVTAAYGPPDSDTGWSAMPTDFVCWDAAAEYRSVFWDDLRVVFERSGPAEQLTAWSVGDQRPSILAPVDPHRPTGSLGLTAADGVHVGADVQVLDQFPLVNDNGDGTYDIAATIAIRISTVDGVITGVAVGRNDCV